MSRWYMAFVNGTEIQIDGIELTLDDSDIDDLIEDGYAEELDDILDGMRVVMPKKQKEQINAKVKKPVSVATSSKGRRRA